MRIVDRETFLQMPTGTVYAKYEPCCFEEVSIKGETCYGFKGEAIDWFCQSLNSPNFEGVNDSGAWMHHLDAIQAGEPSGKLEEVESRDGLFDSDQLFAVWELADVRFLITLLANAAQAIEAGTATTKGRGPKDESAVGACSADAPKGVQP